MGVSQASSAARFLKDKYYPCADGKPVAETEIHLMLILNTIACFRHFFRPRRHEVYVGGNMFLYYREGNPKKRRAPDVMVVKGVDGRVKRRSFKIWEEKTAPRTILEFTSKETAAEDLGAKKTLYRSLKVREYFLFDPLHEYLPQPLLGLLLAGRSYQPMIPEADGSLVSQELGLRLRPVGNNLEFYDIHSQEKLLPIEDAFLRLDDAFLQLAETERKLKREKRKSAKLQAELKRLRQPRERKNR